MIPRQTHESRKPLIGMPALKMHNKDPGALLMHEDPIYQAHITP